MSSELSEKLTAALALAVTQKPRANLQQLAAMAGVSKATLYRISPTREGLISLLQTRAEQHMRAALTAADLARPPFTDALHRLTLAVMSDRALYMFWNISLWMDLGNTRGWELNSYTNSFYSQTLEAFFLAGQKAGMFRIELSAAWLAKSYDYLLYGAAESAGRGEVATVGLEAMVDEMFLDGARAK